MHHIDRKKDKFQIRIKSSSKNPATLNDEGEYLQQFKRARLMDDYNAERGR